MSSHSEAVKSALEKEQECLLQMKDMITQQLKILRVICYVHMLAYSLVPRCKARRWVYPAPRNY